ncbi:hypothetical protein DNTS_032692 [Danionella cerebrum]|uniref:Neurocan core protein n=1 Tax=Danionella cerebrum TaxID=2873325 RepID=A0A553MPW7_9TELE|nr:hypothetical protein DNTS_032692 [Danionella translucida]
MFSAALKLQVPLVLLVLSFNCEHSERLKSLFIRAARKSCRGGALNEESSSRRHGFPIIPLQREAETLVNVRRVTRAPLQRLPGGSVLLPCVFSLPAPLLSTHGPFIRWTHGSESHQKTLLSARDGVLRVHRAFAGRLSLPGYNRDPLNASLQLQQVQSKDSGTFRCSVALGASYQLDTVELRVTDDGTTLFTPLSSLLLPEGFSLFRSSHTFISQNLRDSRITNQRVQADADLSSSDPQTPDLPELSDPEPSNWTGRVDLDTETLLSHESLDSSEEYLTVRLREGETSPDWSPEQDSSSRETPESDSREEEDERLSGKKSRKGPLNNLVSSLWRPWSYLTGSDAEEATMKSTVASPESPESRSTSAPPSGFGTARREQDLVLACAQPSLSDETAFDVMVEPFVVFFLLLRLCKSSQSASIHDFSPDEPQRSEPDRQTRQSNILLFFSSSPEAAPVTPGDWLIVTRTPEKPLDPSLSSSTESFSGESRVMEAEGSAWGDSNLSPFTTSRQEATKNPTTQQDASTTSITTTTSTLTSTTTTAGVEREARGEIQYRRRNKGRKPSVSTTETSTTPVLNTTASSDQESRAPASSSEHQTPASPTTTVSISTTSSISPSTDSNSSAAEQADDRCSCLHGGTCLPHGEGFQCFCPQGYMGESCEIDVDECQSNPCENGGSCIDKVDSFVCMCLPSYSGDRCEKDTQGCDLGWKKFHGHCYRVFPRRHTWEDAEKVCREHSSHLSSISSSAEMHFLNDLAQENVWIGLNDRTVEEDFQWTDGSDVVFENWRENQPDNFFAGGEDCVVMITREDGKWNDVPCNYNLPYICRKATVMCGSPPAVENASLLGRRRSQYEIQSVVRYQCVEGFLQRHTPAVRCRPNGSWERPRILCTKCEPQTPSAQYKRGCDHVILLSLQHGDLIVSVGNTTDLDMSTGDTEDTDQSTGSGVKLSPAELSQKRCGL